MCSRLFAVVSALTLVVGVGCGGGAETPKKSEFKKSRSLAEMAAAQPKMTAEELAEARKKSGLKSRDEIAAENAAMFEKGAREYIKAREKDYARFTGEFRKMLDGLEKSATKWAASKKPQRAFDTYAKKAKPAGKAFKERYDSLTGRGAEGGNTQALLSKAFRAWDEGLRGLSLDMAKKDGFAAKLAEIRAELDKVDAAVLDIAKDETLVVSKRDGK
ncbi:MAG: hypothetical protein V3V08_21375 [Nannocystaceae bacterium]